MELMLDTEALFTATTQPLVLTAVEETFWISPQSSAPELASVITTGDVPCHDASLKLTVVQVEPRLSSEVGTWNFSAEPSSRKFVTFCTIPYETFSRCAGYSGAKA